MFVIFTIRAGEKLVRRRSSQDLLCLLNWNTRWNVTSTLGINFTYPFGKEPPENVWEGDSLQKNPNQIPLLPVELVCTSVTAGLDRERHITDALM